MFSGLYDCSLVAISWESADPLALLTYVMFYCVFVTFPCDVLGQVWCLIVLIPDLSHFMQSRCQKRFNQNGNQSLISQCIYSNIIHKYPSFFARQIIHVSIKDLRVCANNSKLEDFIIQNHY